MSALLGQCFQSVDETRDAILARWKRLTDIDSGSSDKAGVDAVSRLVEDQLRTLGFFRSRCRLRKSGPPSHC